MHYKYRYRFDHIQITNLIFFRRRSRDRDRRRSPSPPSVKLPFPRRTRSPIGLGYSRSSPLEELSPEERDARTVFCMQLSQRIRARDLEEFFSSVGKVRDVRLITCNKTRRFKGIAYIEFRDPESVPLVSYPRQIRFNLNKFLLNLICFRRWVCPVRNFLEYQLLYNTHRLKKIEWVIRCPT